MLTNIRLRNMKALEDTGDLTIKPLTMLIGPNSAGKSTVLQSLLMIKQTVDSRDLRNPLTINGPWVEMGSFRDIIRARDTDSTLGVDLSFASRNPFGWVARTLDLPTNTFSSETAVSDLEIGLLAQASFKETRDGRVGSQKFAFEYIGYFSDEYPDLAPSGKVLLQEDEKRYACNIRVPGIKDDQINFTDYEWYRTVSKFYDFLPEQSQYDTWAFLFTQGTIYDFEDAFSSFHYLGPLRARPQRVYNVSGETPHDVGHAGERFADVLISAGSQKLETKVDEWMAKFHIAAEVKLERMGPGYFFVQLTNPFSKVPVNLADSGFGGSQVIPIIVEGFFAQQDALILLEQPEIHLHPRAQGVLGDLLVDIANEGRRLIVETHSEHMLGRIQTNIAEGRNIQRRCSRVLLSARRNGNESARVGFGRQRAVRV